MPFSSKQIQPSLGYFLNLQGLHIIEESTRVESISYLVIRNLRNIDVSIQAGGYNTNQSVLILI